MRAAWRKGRDRWRRGSGSRCQRELKNHLVTGMGQGPRRRDLPCRRRAVRRRQAIQWSQSDQKCRGIGCCESASRNTSDQPCWLSCGSRVAAWSGRQSGWRRAVGRLLGQPGIRMESLGQLARVLLGCLHTSLRMVNAGCVWCPRTFRRMSK